MKKDINILLVDDDPLIENLIKYLLKDLPYTLQDVASSGKEGIKKALKIKPDIILMDVIMETPHAGIDAARIIKSKMDVPIVFLTASKRENTLVKALKTNPFGYLVKPIQKESFYSTIAVVLARHGYEKKLNQYQDALKESEKLFRGIFSEMKNGWYRLSQKGDIMLVNHALVDLLEYSRDNQLIGKNFVDLGSVDRISRNIFFKILKKKDEISTFESEWRTRTNKIINILENAHAIRDDEGKLLYYEGTVQNITKMKELELKIRHSKQMEVIGKLVGRISHEINSRLSVILGYADLSLLQLKPKDKLYKYAKAIKSNAQLTAEVVHQLLKISRKPASKVIEFDLNQSLKSWKDVFKKVLGDKIVLKLKLNSNSTTIFADPQQIEHVIINLLANARDSMPTGGKITIETIDQNVDENFKWKFKLLPGLYSSITISDTGIGIQNKLLDKIFDPFFTTKDPTVGTGLGLSIVKNIVHENHGHIAVHSENKKGTAFNILLPAAQAVSQSFNK